jgi:ethanolamine ammonia-lyase large subunit
LDGDQDDMDNLLTILVVAGCSFIMGVPGSDDIMLNYQSTSFHDALYVRRVLIGERSGLNDSSRNCISNIRPAVTHDRCDLEK